MAKRRSTRGRRSKQPSRYTGKTRRYTKRRPMSKKRILNITSQKKRDKMMSWSNVTVDNPGGAPTYQVNPAILKGGSSEPYVLAWCATARNNETNNANPGTKFDQATRTSSHCYMVGLKENIQIQILSGLPWQWRRICFTFKGKNTLGGYLPAISSTWQPYSETSSGYQRTLNNVPSTSVTDFFNLLFQGRFNTDWKDPMIAQADPQRITVKYDKVTTVASGNEQGVIRKYPRWHPMRKNLEYDDDEQGGGMGASHFSVESKLGMGDYWIIDIIVPRVGSNADDLATFGTESTLYWHER